MAWWGDPWSPAWPLPRVERGHQEEGEEHLGEEEATGRGLERAPYGTRAHGSPPAVRVEEEEEEISGGGRGGDLYARRQPRDPV